MCCSMVIFLYLHCSLAFYSLAFGDQKSEMHAKLVYSRLIRVDSPAQTLLRIEVWQDTSWNLLILICDSTCNTWSIISGVYVPFSFIVDSIYSCELNGTPPVEYVLRTSNAGSTYGSGRLVIVWYWRGNWHISVAPFELGEVRDIDQDGVCEILDYAVPGRRIFEYYDIYRFCNGGYAHLGTRKAK